MMIHNYSQVDEILYIESGENAYNRRETNL